MEVFKTVKVKLTRQSKIDYMIISDMAFLSTIPEWIATDYTFWFHILRRSNITLQNFNELFNDMLLKQ